jgi:hypothetical protein
MMTAVTILTRPSPDVHLTVACWTRRWPKLAAMTRISRPKARILAGALVLGVVALAGCSSSNNSSGSGKVTLVVYSAQGYDSAMVKAFHKATGIPVSLDDNSTGPLLTQLEASRNNPKWGLLWVDGATAFAGPDATVEVESAGPGLLRPLRARASGPKLADGDAMLLIRPTGVQLVGAHNGDHHLAGTVADVAFRGRGYEHAIDITGHGRLTGVFATVRAERGETVGLRLDPAGCHVFAAEKEPADA